jgi:hypothetical protein
MNLFQKYGIKEVADVVFYSIDEIGDEQVYTPVLYLDSLKVSTLEQTAEKTEAKGGLGNKKLITWNYGKEVTLSLQDALFTPASMSMVWGGKLDNHLSPYMSAALKCNLANQYLQNHYSTKAYPSPSLTDEEWELVYQAASDVKFSTGLTASDGEVKTRWFSIDNPVHVNNNDNNVDKWKEKLRSAYYNRNTCFPLPQFVGSDQNGKHESGTSSYDQTQQTMDKAFGLNILPYISQTNTLSSFTYQTSLDNHTTLFKPDVENTDLLIGNYDFTNSSSGLKNSEINNVITNQIHEIVIDDEYINYLHNNMENIALNLNIGDFFYFSLNDLLKQEDNHITTDSNNNKVCTLKVDESALNEYADALFETAKEIELTEAENANDFRTEIKKNVAKALCYLYTKNGSISTLDEDNYSCTLNISDGYSDPIYQGYNYFNKSDNDKFTIDMDFCKVENSNELYQYWNMNQYFQKNDYTSSGKCLLEKILLMVFFGYNKATTVFPIKSADTSDSGGLELTTDLKNILRIIFRIYLNHKIEHLEGNNWDQFMTNMIVSNNSASSFEVNATLYKIYAIFKLIRENLNDIIENYHNYFIAQCFVPAALCPQYDKDNQLTGYRSRKTAIKNCLILSMKKDFFQKYCSGYLETDPNSNINSKLKIYTTQVDNNNTTIYEKQSFKSMKQATTSNNNNINSITSYIISASTEATLTNVFDVTDINQLIQDDENEYKLYQYSKYYKSYSQSSNGDGDTKTICQQYAYGSLAVFQLAIPVYCFYTSNLTNTRYSTACQYDYHNYFNAYLLISFSPIVKNRQLTGVRPFFNNLNECYQVRLVNDLKISNELNDTLLTVDQLKNLFAGTFNPKSKDKKFYLCTKPEKLYGALTAAIDTFDTGKYSAKKTWGSYVADNAWGSIDTSNTTTTKKYSYCNTEDEVLNQIAAQTQEYSYYAMSPYIIQRLIQNIRTESDYTKVETSNDMVLDVIDRMEKCVVTKRGGLKISRKDQERNILRYYTDDKSSSYEIYYDVKTMTPLFHYYSASENVDFYRDTLIPAEQAYNQDQGLGTSNNSKTLIKKMQGNSKEQGTTKYYIDQEHDEFVLPVGSVYYKWTRTVVNNQYVPGDYTLGEQTLGERIVINPDTFPEKYKIVGNTYIRNQKTGKDECYQFTIHRASIGVDTNITLEAEGDPTVFDMSVDVLCPPNNVMMELKQYSVIEDKEKGGTKVVPYGTQRSKTYTKIDDMVESINLENNEIY